MQSVIGDDDDLPLPRTHQRANHRVLGLDAREGRRREGALIGGDVVDTVKVDQHEVRLALGETAFRGREDLVVGGAVTVGVGIEQRVPGEIQNLYLALDEACLHAALLGPAEHRVAGQPVDRAIAHPGGRRVFAADHRRERHGRDGRVDGHCPGGGQSSHVRDVASIPGGDVLIPAEAVEVEH